VIVTKAIKLEGLRFIQFNGLRKFNEDEPRDEKGEWTSGGVAVLFEPSAGYIQGLRSDLRARAQELGTFKTSDEVFALGYRESDPVTFAMAEHVEKATDRDTMLKVMGSQLTWGTGHEVAAGEWLGAQALGASKEMSRTTAHAIKSSGIVMSPKLEAGYRARTAFAQAWIEKTYGKEITVYRGIKGKQSKGIEESGNHDVALGVRGLASFSVSRFAASSFAGKTGKVLTATIKPSDVFSTNEIGLKNVVRYGQDSGELVVMNSGKTRAVKW